MDPNAAKPVVFDPRYSIPSDILDDVICRFLLNIPKEEKFDSVRVCFQIELAHWFFVDFHCGEGCTPHLAGLRNIPYAQFAYMMFQKTPHLRSRLPEIDKHLSAFRVYKMRVPTYGAILLNTSLTKLVLVQGFRNHWGFPKGKVNEVEEPVSCAIREVFEETGYDISNLVNPNHFIESKVLERVDRLYVVCGVDENYPFEPQTQFEIKSVKWFNISELPEHKKDTTPAVLKNGVPLSNFYSVFPYVKRLKSWIVDKMEHRNKIQSFKVRNDSEAGEYYQENVSTSNLRSKKSIGAQSKPSYTVVPCQQNQQQQASSKSLLGPGPGSSAAGQQGWTLFQGENKPYVMNSNAIQELLLSSQTQLTQQQRQNTVGGPTKSKGNQNKNARRRLFSEDGNGDGKKTQTPVSHGQSVRVLHKGETLSKTSLPEMKKSETQINFSSSTHPWANFTFDRERVFKAFFTPSG